VSIGVFVLGGQGKIVGWSWTAKKCGQFLQFIIIPPPVGGGTALKVTKPRSEISSFELFFFFKLVNPLPVSSPPWTRRIFTSGLLLPSLASLLEWKEPAFWQLVHIKVSSSSNPFYEHCHFGTALASHTDFYKIHRLLFVTKFFASDQYYSFFPMCIDKTIAVLLGVNFRRGRRWQDNPQLKWFCFL